MTSCPVNKDQWKKSLTIYPVGLTEKLHVNLELICECECEAEDLGVSSYHIMLCHTLLKIELYVLCVIGVHSIS